MLLSSIQTTAETLVKEFDIIPAERKTLLKSLTAFIQERVSQQKPVTLNFICTHNSRRSHLSQLWAQAAAAYYGIDNVRCLSGGTEATAFNPNAVKAMGELGFKIEKTTTDANPVYDVYYGSSQPVKAFSKTFDDPFNKSDDFAAIMTCSHADENCPAVPGATKRIAITYDDPKASDGTPQQDATYKERALQIGREMLYAFSLIARS